MSRPPASTRGLKPRTSKRFYGNAVASSREYARIETVDTFSGRIGSGSRPPASTRGLKQLRRFFAVGVVVASSREYARIETPMSCNRKPTSEVASSREVARIETRCLFPSKAQLASRPRAITRGLKRRVPGCRCAGRVLPRLRAD